MRELLINGELVQGAHTLDVINPATGQVFETISRADKTQLETAIQGAKTAFPKWAALAHKDRADKLIQISNAIEAQKDDFVRTLTLEQGKPLLDANREVDATIASLRGYAQMELPETILREDQDFKIIEHHSPLGVVAAIAPWNYPLMILTNKIAPALIAGNTVVAKPAPTTPITALMFGKIAADILPKGTLSIIVDDNDLGSILTSHPDIAKLSFTGSTATGKKVMQSGADSLKRVTLELGGNDAALILDDVDVETIAPKIFGAAMVNSGQVCIAVKRVYAPRAIYDDLCTRLAELASEFAVGDGLEQGTKMGPVQNKMQFEKLKDFLADAHASGKVIAGGHALEKDGYFIEPTIVRDIDDTAKLVHEEQFGPILPVLVYDDLDATIDKINDTEFGLGGSVWSQDVNKATAIAKQIDSGTVWVNQHVNLQFDIPFGGSKKSGIGREKGMPGLLEYTQPKVVNVALN